MFRQQRGGMNHLMYQCTIERHIRSEIRFVGHLDDICLGVPVSLTDRVRLDRTNPRIVSDSLVQSGYGCFLNVVPFAGQFGESVQHLLVEFRVLGLDSCLVQIEHGIPHRFGHFMIISFCLVIHL